MLFSWCCRWFFPITSPAVHELERNVTTAEHPATMRYLMNAFIFWLISILPPFSFVSRRRFSERISSLSGGSLLGWFPFVFFFSEDFPVRDSKDSLQGLESGLTNFGLNSASQLEKNIFPVGKVIFQRFLNHDAKIRHSSYPVVRCRAIVKHLVWNPLKFYHFRFYRAKFYQFRVIVLNALVLPVSLL